MSGWCRDQPTTPKRDAAQGFGRPTIQGRPEFKTYGKPLTLRTGVNGKRQVNLFDPDGTRVELMEPATADGKPVPSSTVLP